MIKGTRLTYEKANLENQIQKPDHEICKLHGLTKEEIKLIEESLK